MTDKKSKFNSIILQRKNSIQDEFVDKFKKKKNLVNTNRSSPRNKRSISQLQNIEPFHFKTTEKSTFLRPNTDNSLNIPDAIENKTEEDGFSTTFKNMFENFSKLSEIMSSSCDNRYELKEDKLTKTSINTKNKSTNKMIIETYEPLSQSEKIKYLEEINRGSELRISAYTSIFNTIKNQISLISQRKEIEKETVDKSIINNLQNPKVKLKENNMDINNDLNFNEKNVNIINNNITVNIISADMNKKKSSNNVNSAFSNNVESKSMKNQSVKGVNRGNSSMTGNEDVEEENRINYIIKVHSNSYKSKTDLEKSDYSGYKQSENDYAEVDSLRNSKKLSSNNIITDDSHSCKKYIIYHVSLDIRSTFLIAKSELHLMKQHKANERINPF